MLKTRRAGRKNQLRRLIARYYRTASTDYIDIVQPNHYDEKYELLFSGKVISSGFEIK